MKPSRPNTSIICDHCGDWCPDTNIIIGEKIFCCTGCKSVYQILHEYELCNYYEMNHHPGVTQKNHIRKDKFGFIDHPDISRKIIQYTDGNTTHVTFYLPQIHCSSCLWLLENIRRINKGILSSRVNFPNKEVFIVFDAKIISLREVIETLTQIGYEPHLNLDAISPGTKPKMDRRRWYKIGLAGFCFTNIMMMSFPQYFSGSGVVEPLIKTTLTFLIVVLSIPVITYCASEFFINAWNGLKNKYLNIDAPIALALLITFGRSIYEIINHTGPGYLDSMSGIVFFMLIGRWAQDRTYQAISFDRDFRSFFPIAVNTIKNNIIQSVPVDQIKVNDIIQIHHQELIPVDAILSRGQAEIDYSFVTGESLPVRIEKGEIVYAGGKQTGGLLELLVIKEVAQSYLTHLWNKDMPDKMSLKRSPFVDILGKYFTYFVLTIAITAGSYWFIKGQPLLMWNALTTILIVACPCALLLSSGFTSGNILRILSLNKLYLKNANVIESLLQIDTIVFDKTGTLTQNHKMKVTYEGMMLTEKMKMRITALLSHSNHPLSKAILHYLHTPCSDKVESFRILQNQGIEGWMEDHHLKIGSPEFVGVPSIKKTQSTVVISMDSTIIGVFSVSNAYRMGVFDLIRLLKNKYKLSLISGDNNSEQVRLQEKMGYESELLFNQSPHDKLVYIQYLQNNLKAKVLMIGDGLNDAGALKESLVGIAVCDDDNNFTPAADGIIHASKISVLNHMLAFVKSSKKIIVLSFCISILYNIVGLYFAVQGTLSPVIAAILMPGSTITIILITFGLTEWMARIYKLA